MNSHLNGALVGKRLTTKAVRLLAVSAVIATPSLIFATPAHAASTGMAEVAGQVVRFTSTGNTVNSVTVSKLGTTYLIDDIAAITPGAGCRYPTAADHTQVWCEAPNATSVFVSVGGGNDVVNNTADVRSTIIGGLGDDQLHGGRRADTLSGEFGDDRLWGRYGDDSLHGGPGNDRITGWYGDDTVFAGTGNDVVSGENGDDTIFGSTGNDNLSGDNGDDKLYGNENNDLLNGGSGTNLLRGGTGSDNCVNGPNIAQCE